MAWLILGLLLWISAHLFKRVLPTQRASMGNAGKGLVAAMALAGIVLMVIGYGEAEKAYLYDLPDWVWHLNNVLMFFAVLFMGTGVGGLIQANIRHPMLTGVVTWSIAHLLVNGDVPSLILFGSMATWALLEMAIINRAEGPWSPQLGHIAKDVKSVIIAAVLFAVFVSVHYWLGYSVLAVLN